jgi:hypothetical protein
MKEEFFEHINSQHSMIKLAVEEESNKGILPFLDCLVKKSSSGSLETTVYRKSRNSGRYLNFQSTQYSQRRQS